MLTDACERGDYPEKTAKIIQINYPEKTVKINTTKIIREVCET